LLPAPPSYPSFPSLSSSPPLFLLFHFISLLFSPLLVSLPFPYHSSSPLFFLFPSPINPDGVWGSTVSSAQARPPNDFWCIVTLKLRSFPLAYRSVLFYFADFIRRPWGEKQWRRATGFFWLRGDRPHRASGVGADDNRMT